MTDSPPTPPPGWYPAPHANGEQRYWDGQTWTEQPTPPGSVDQLSVESAVASTALPVEMPPRKRRRIRWWGWTLIGVGAIIILIIIIGSLNSPKNATPAATASAVKQSATPAAEDTTPTPEPPPPPAVAHQQYKGRGDMVQKVNITSPAIVTFVCNRCRDNTVLESNGSEGLLVNEIGAYKGQHLINVYTGDVTTQFTITANAPWVLTIEDIAAARQVTGAASGHGDSVVMMASTFTSAAITNNGSSNFVVQAYGGDNSSPLIVNKIGAYSGTVPMSGPAYVQIESTGNWTITPQQ